MACTNVHEMIKFIERGNIYLIAKLLRSNVTNHGWYHTDTKQRTKRYFVFYKH